ncbi:MAG: nucleotidyltransferase domain-containing protein [Nitrospirae bacterium]|nr:nucleotidyltransferase domain-containing protein [Nitrospirota bacterium]
MALTKDDALEIARSFLVEAKKQHEISSAYLFGSYVSGREKDWSDIDLAVVLAGKSISHDRYVSESFEIFHEAQEYNSLLEVVCFRQEEFEEIGASIVSRIKREGIPVTTP